MQTQLTVEHVSKTYQNAPIFSDISLRVAKGEFVSILGPSGCGKTTLLHCIAGIENPTSGKVTMSQKPGYMLQKPLLLPWKTALQNVMLGLQLTHISEIKAKEQALSILKQFHLQPAAALYPKNLSGGMAQRVALLRTILFNNHFLLMDEPFGALDSLTRLSMQMWLLSVWEKYKASVVFVTHDIREAILLSDRIIVLGDSPTKIIKEITIDLPRPRKRNMLQQKKALILEKKLEDLLLSNQL